MKQIIIILLFAFNMSAQTFTATCHKCATKQTMKCNNCPQAVMSGSSFTGIEIKSASGSVFIKNPYEVKNKQNTFEIKEQNSKVVHYIDVTKVTTYNTVKKFYDFLNNCSCVMTGEEISFATLSTHYDGEFVGAELPEQYFVSYSNYPEKFLFSESESRGIVVDNDSIKISRSGLYNVAFNLNGLQGDNGEFNISMMNEDLEIFAPLLYRTTHRTTDFISISFNTFMYLEPGSYWIAIYRHSYESIFQPVTMSVINATYSIVEVK